MRKLLFALAFVLLLPIHALAATQTRQMTGTTGSTFPHADGWTTLVGCTTNKWECIDEGRGTPDDDTSYLERSASFAAQSFSFTAFSITSSAITKVSLYGRSRYTEELDGNTLIMSLIVNGNLYNGATNNNAITYTNWTQDWLTNPNTASSWVEADVEGTGGNPLEAARFHVGSMAGGDTVRVTAFEIEVDYTAAGGGPTIRRSAIIIQ